MAMSPKEIRESMARLGIPMLPPDHPEYTSGPQVHFLSRTSLPLKKKSPASTARKKPVDSTPTGEGESVVIRKADPEET